MKFFSKITFICNLCFLTTIIIHFIEAGKIINGKPDTTIALPFVVQIVVILGQIAILINIIFCTIALIKLLSKRAHLLYPRWITIFNVIILLLQVYWFFVDKGK